MSEMLKKLLQRSSGSYQRIQDYYPIASPKKTVVFNPGEEGMGKGRKREENFGGGKGARGETRTTLAASQVAAAAASITIGGPPPYFLMGQPLPKSANFIYERSLTQPLSQSEALKRWPLCASPSLRYGLHS
ncbi:hypothetical protein CDAR_18401 [Caerostris darwini]|uniref:Uncharacterized protein n=1 Tax=Caerostris darwini TaxID=1538125 RepID=A0AAV4V9K8_9ARAC|nr:hypothetical protein CDAR_18401 [Caerostris darwini]